MIDLTASAPLGFVDIKRAAFHGGNSGRRQADFVLHWLAVIGQLQFRVIDVAEFPKHPEEIGLTTKQ